MTVKGLHVNTKPSVFSLEDGPFSNGSSHSSSPSRDVNLNHLKIVNPAQHQQSPSHNQGFSPSSSPTREVPESPTQKSVGHMKEKKEDRYVIEPAIEPVKNEEFVLKSPEKERSAKHDASSTNEHAEETVAYRMKQFQNDNKDEPINGRTAINIPGDLPSPKSKAPPAVVEKRNSLRQEQKEHRDHHRDQHHNGAKVSNHHNNNNKVNSASLNNLILPLLSDVSWPRNMISLLMNDVHV